MNDSPRWLQIYEELRDRLVTGEFDARFPTDRELVQAYGVSRHTVREAVRGLQDEGLITRRRGSGSFRTPTSFALPMGLMYSLFRSVEDQGGVPTSVVIAQEVRYNEVAAKVLGLAADNPLFFLERARLADREPLALDKAWLPMPLAEPLLEANFTRTGLYQELRERCDVVPEGGREESRPITLDRAAAVRLGLSVGDAAFQIDRRTWTGDTPLEWRISIVRGDRFAFQADWNTPWDSSRPNAAWSEDRTETP